MIRLLIHPDKVQPEEIGHDELSMEVKVDGEMKHISSFQAFVVALDVYKRQTYSYQKINDSHHWNHGRRERSHSMEATEDEEQGEHSEGNSHGGRLDAKSLLPCQADSIALY